MSRFDFIILTDDTYMMPATARSGEVVWQEDMILLEALEKRGFKVGRKSWADRDFDWSHTRAAIFRSTWDYCHRFEEWKRQLDHMASKTRLINTAETVLWNMDKHYLGDMEARGVNIPETRYIETGTEASLEALYQECGWDDAILKPCIAGTARHTYRLNGKNLAEHEDIFQGLIITEAMMLQPFQRYVVEQGEISVIILGGSFSHAVIKRAKTGDFRVQGDFGGTVTPYEPSQEEAAFAEKAVKACSPMPAYARVDIIRDNAGELALIEIELIEPELWFRLYPLAAHTLADHLSQLDI